MRPANYKGKMTRYTGGKNGAGVYQHIINLMPPHDCYIECFLGSGAVMRFKKPAKLNYAIDLDATIFETFSDCLPDYNNEDSQNAYKFLCSDARDILPSILPMGDHHTLIYADPPYPLAVRSTKRAIYKYEMLTDAEHFDLLTLLKSLPCMVMVSGYRYDLYDEMLISWRRSDYYTVNRAGRRVQESVWMNFAEPIKLHDYSFLGETANRRQDFKRLKERQIARLERMPAVRRYALLAAIEEYSQLAQAKAPTLEGR